MKHRGFSLLEVMVVVAVVGIGSTVAVFAMSEQVGDARSRSDRIGLALKMKTERDRARERLTGLSISRDAADPHIVIFHKPVFSGMPGYRSCANGDEVARARFDRATLDTPAGPLCLDENGLPIGSFVVNVVGDDGATDVITINDGGTFDNSNKSGGGGGPETSDPTPPIPQP